MRSRLDLAAGHLTRFVGRQAELSTLLAAWERAMDGAGQTMLVQAEAGVGKSRLLYQLREQLAGTPHTWLECRASPYTSGTAFQPVIELVEQGLFFSPADTPAEKRAKLDHGLAEEGMAVNETVPLLAEFLSLPAAAGYAPLQMSPELACIAPGAGVSPRRRQGVRPYTEPETSFRRRFAPSELPEPADAC